MHYASQFPAFAKVYGLLPQTSCSPSGHKPQGAGHEAFVEIVIQSQCDLQSLTYIVSNVCIEKWPHLS